MNPTADLAAAAEAKSRSGAADATIAAPIERPVTRNVSDGPSTPSTGHFIDKSGYKTLIDAALSRPSFATGKIVPRGTNDDGLRDFECVIPWRQGEERELNAWCRIRRRLSMLGLVLAGDAMILSAVLLLTGIFKF